MKAAALIGALTVSFYTIFLFWFSFSPAHTHHVIFEEIGEMFGALSYIHVVIPINILGLLQAVLQFRESHSTEIWLLREKEVCSPAGQIWRHQHE